MIDVYKIAFGLIKGNGVDLASKILEVIPSESDFFTLSQKELEELVQGKNHILESNYRRSILEKAKRETDFIERNNISLKYFKEDNYPKRLLDAQDAPILLFSKGNLNLNSKHIISIVGTRNATEYGKSVTDEIIKVLSEELPETVIISGLAYGIDIAAHKSSLKYNLPTAAILAHGLNCIYPAQHRNYAVDIIKHSGSLITEYTSQDKINKGNFLARNRIVASLSDCTLVVESAEKGGSLVTAAIANSYNREVFAVPGKINDKYSIGCNNLISTNKAILVNSAFDIIKHMNWESVTKPNKMDLSLFPEYTAEEKEIIDYLTVKGKTHINQISNDINLPIHKTMSLLIDMEFKGYIKSLPGGNFAI